jgi:hypothetical protein
MSQASALLAAGQSFAAGHFPAQIRISGVEFAAAFSGRRAEVELAEFGATAGYSLGFWMPVASFTAAGQPLPSALTTIDVMTPAAAAGRYAITAVVPDPAGVNVVIRCSAPPQ